MKTKYKLLLSLRITITAALGIATVMAILWVYSSYFDPRWEFPSQLQVGKTLHHQGKIHAFGPSGINRTFTVYKLSKKISQRINNEGVEFLNSSPLTYAQKRRTRYPDGDDLYEDISMIGWKPFIDWQATPQETEDNNSGNQGRNKKSPPSFLSRFYGQSQRIGQFVESIPAAFADPLEDSISSPGSFVIKGGCRGKNWLIIAPSQQMVFYLYHN
tara:strand:- start:845 stop:1489 length:645 start_codon:yes stop_codon:yes gene_type:complete